VNKSFDIFLSHNSKDKPAVRGLAEALRARGLSVWLDDWELVPGRSWQEALEEVIETTRSAAVLVGKDGLGPWQDAEMRGCLAEFVGRKLPVIPVLLPDAPSEPKLPFFLRRFTWVDLRGVLTEEGLDRLQWGITGQKPTAMAHNNDLNEPQSLAEARPLVPPPQRALGSTWAQATDHNAIMAPPSIAPVGSPGSLPTPPTEGRDTTVSRNVNWPSRQGLLVVPGRTTLVASMSALLLLTLASALVGWLWWTSPRAGQDAQKEVEQKQAVEPISSSPQRWVIQVFAHSDRSQAQKIVTRLQKLGQKAYISPILVAGNTSYRVRVGPFSDRESASRAAESINKEGHLDTWIIDD
jgi:hypothetical protein